MAKKAKKKTATRKVAKKKKVVKAAAKTKSKAKVRAKTSSKKKKTPTGSKPKTKRTAKSSQASGSRGLASLIASLFGLGSQSKKAASSSRSKKGPSPLTRTSRSPNLMVPSHPGALMLSFFGSLLLTLVVVWQIASPQADRRTASYEELSRLTVPGQGKNLTELGKLFAKANPLSVSERVEFWSHQVSKNHGIPKNWKAEFGSLPKINDSAPLVPRSYNCTTFVETVTALVRSRKPSDFYTQVKHIRYRSGDATFVARNHFPSIDWIPNNQNAGILKDATLELADSFHVKVDYEEKSINRKKWMAAQVRNGIVTRAIASSAGSSWSETVKAKVGYVPLAEMKRFYSKIPSGMIVNLVRANRSPFPVLVSHQGFFIRKNGKPYFRHVTSKGKFQTVPMGTYFSRYHSKKYRSGKWPVLGINVNAIHDDRSSSLVGRKVASEVPQGRNQISSKF